MPSAPGCEHFGAAPGAKRVRIAVASPSWPLSNIQRSTFFKITAKTRRFGPAYALSRCVLGSRLH